MQLRRPWSAAALALVACFAGATKCAALGDLDEQSAEALMQMFSDSHHLAVRSAIGNYNLSMTDHSALVLHWNHERVVVPAIQAPAGSQQAIDAITTASRPIAGNAFQDFVKVRNELEGSVQHRHATIEYYRSQETDYLGQQLAASYERDLRKDQLNLSVGTSYGWDAIEPLADDDTQSGTASKRTLHGNAVATGVLSPTTLLRVGVELNVVDGLQHNPYRNVYAGGTHVPERHPDHRQRRDLFLKLNHYLSNRSSVKLQYRFYDDDWGIDSHELGTKLSQYVTHAVFASWEYRYYTQTRADFYRTEYESTSGVDGYLTGDYRMGPLSSHLFGVSLDVDLSAMGLEQPVLARMGLRCGYERYFNSNNYSANILTTQATYRF